MASIFHVTFLVGHHLGSINTVGLFLSATVFVLIVTLSDSYLESTEFTSLDK
jgi:hypothetical protein